MFFGGIRSQRKYQAGTGIYREFNIPRDGSALQPFKDSKERIDESSCNHHFSVRPDLHAIEQPVVHLTSAVNECLLNQCSVPYDLFFGHMASALVAGS